MPLDQRQTQIKEGAGLEESRLNVEFIDWLRRWSTPILLVVAVIALIVVVRERLRRAEVERVSRAFESLEAAAGAANPSPVSLLGVAEEFSGVRAVSLLARLRAADTYLSAVRRGIEPGAVLNDDGTPQSPDDLMDDQARTRALDEAARLYRSVIDDASGQKGRAVHAIGAAFGLAAVAECRADAEAARKAYQTVIDLAGRAGFPDQAERARARQADLAERLAMPRLFAVSELPKLPWDVEPPVLPPEAAQPESPDAVQPSSPFGPLPGPFQPVEPPAQAPDPQPADPQAAPPAPTPDPQPAPAPPP